MAYEKECDKVLLFAFAKEDSIDSDEIITSLLISSDVTSIVIPILKHEKFLKYYVKCYPIDDGAATVQGYGYRITTKGIAFLHTDTFVDRKARWDLEKKTNMLEYSLKKRTFGIAVAALIISMLTFLKSSCNDKSNDNIGNQPPSYNQTHINNPVVK
jgi:hypothetical protein